MRTVQYNPASDTVVLTGKFFRELMERCGELEESAPTFEELCERAGSLPTTQMMIGGGK